MADQMHLYPPVGFHFSVRLADENGYESSFQEVRGISYDIQTEQLEEGGNNAPYKVPKSISYPNLVLKRGFLKSSMFRDWCENTINTGSFNVIAKNVVVNLLNTKDHEVIIAWTFQKAIPSSTKYPASMPKIMNWW